MLHGNFDNSPYFYREGKIFTGLTVVEYLLADEGPGDGGMCVREPLVRLFVTPHSSADE
jgi:hypothetical protein